MSDLAYWDDGSEWDSLQLGPHIMPGIWRVEASCERELDQKKSKGKDGSNVKDRGYKSAEVTLVGELYSREEWRAIQQILADLHPRKKGGPRYPYAAQHPSLAVMGISTVYVKGARAPEVSGGICTIRIDAVEWTKPKPAKAKKEPQKLGPNGRPLLRNLNPDGTYTEQEFDPQNLTIQLKKPPSQVMEETFAQEETNARQSESALFDGSPEFDKLPEE